MNVIQSNPSKPATNHPPLFSYPQSTKRQQRLRVFSCSDFRKELSTLNLTSSSSSSSNVDQIKKAYRKMALRYHPDVCDPSMREESTRMFIEIQKAYATLLDQESQDRGCLDTRNKWETQLSELKRQSQRRQEQNDGSWGCRVRAKHN